MKDGKRLIGGVGHFSKNILLTNTTININANGALDDNYNKMLEARLIGRSPIGNMGDDLKALSHNNSFEQGLSNCHSWASRSAYLIQGL